MVEQTIEPTGSTTIGTTVAPFGGLGDGGAPVGWARVASEAGAGYDAGGGAGGGGGEADEAKLSRLLAEVGEADRHMAQAVVLAGEVAGSGVAERVAGQPLEGVLAAACRLTGADRKTLIAAGEALGDMPVLRGRFVEGSVSWAQVRAIAGEVKRRSRSDRAWLDGRLEATVADRGGLGGFEPDELVEAARTAVAERAALADRERGDAEAIKRSLVSVQPDPFGGARAYAA